MARASSKANSMLEKMGFVDEDLKCRDHDAMSVAMSDHCFSSALLRQMPKMEAAVVTSVSLEVPILKGAGKYSSLFGYADARIVFDLNDKGPYGMYLEAKPKLPNPMETLRQINSYRYAQSYDRGEHASKPWWVLWCPNLPIELATLFEEQDISVITSSLASVHDLAEVLRTRPSHVDLC